MFLSGDGLKDRRRKNRQVWKGCVINHRSRVGTSTSPSFWTPSCIIPAPLSFSVTCRSRLLSRLSLSPLSPSLILLNCLFLSPSLPLFDLLWLCWSCGGSSFHSSCLPSSPSPSPSPYHFPIPTFSTILPQRPSSPLSHFISSCCLYSYSTCHYLLI